MSPKEKAKELIKKFSPYVETKDFFGDAVEDRCSKKCALIAADEILKSRPCLPICVSTDGGSSEAIFDANNFWQEVKTEIERL